MFRHRLHLCTFAGIKIGVDLSWIIIAFLLSWSLAVGYFPFYCHALSYETYWVMGIIGMLGLFGSILLHEMGHAIVAQQYQLRVHQITLFIFGGVAEIRKGAPHPKAEFLIAIAGPIVSIIIAIVMYLLTSLGLQANWPLAVKGVTGYLALANIMLVLFNMIPALPLDGGRVLHAFLWWVKKDQHWATNITSALGVGFGFVLLFFGFFFMLSSNFIGGVWLAILGFFLYNAALATRTQSYVAEGLAGQKVSRFMTQNPISIPPNITVKEFLEQYIYQSLHHLYPVTEEGALIGYLSTKELHTLPRELWEKTLVGEVLVPVTKFPMVTPETNAQDALALMNQTDMPTLMVVERGQLVGIVTSQDLLKLIFLKLELDK